jgi:hypothetical protein
VHFVSPLFGHFRNGRLAGQVVHDSAGSYRATER